MGDIADYMIDQMFDRFEDAPFVHGRYRKFTPRALPTCRSCGKERLHWEQVHTAQDTKWVLFEGKSQHVCTIEFEDLSND